MREMRFAFDLLLATARVVFWMIGTLWLGAKVIVRICVLMSRYRAITAETLPCSRGHLVPMYGLFDCACGSRVEGWVYSACPVCGESAGWTPCPVCQLPVRNPLVI